MNLIDIDEKRVDYSVLDFTRGVAAILVFVSHLRYLIFVPSKELISTNYFIKIFYFLTGFGHQAVIVFFVLSGFFITKSVVNNFSTNNYKFSWSFYISNRLTRLWIVLLPSLFFTLIFDKIGSFAYPDSIYYHTIIPGFPVIYPGLNSTWQVFIGNLFFLGDFYFPTFGTNCALWSLSYEFWFYLLFPAIVTLLVTLKVKSIKVKFSSILPSLVITIVICFLVPPKFYGYFIIWLFGALLYYFRVPNKLSGYKKRSTLLLALLLLQFCIVVFVVRSGMFGEVSMLGDIFLGVSFFVFLLFLNDYSLKGRSKKIASYLSEMSYTVYLFHVSLAVFVCNILIKRQFNFVGVSSMVLYFTTFLLVFISCRIFYNLFEANTSNLRSMMKWWGKSGRRNGNK